ncbi:MAG: 50S ribosomal protein L18 [Candidatus Hadarchaeota archaeon]
MNRIGPRYRVTFRRRREGKTDYGQRLKLLKSGKPIFVVRLSLNHVLAQVSKASSVGDMVLVSSHTRDLEKFGWKGGTSNVSSAYLVGLLCGVRALKAGVNECVLDIDNYNPVKGSKIFAVLKGALDAGLKIPHDEAVLPDESRIRGKHIADYAEELKQSSPDVYQARFSKYISRGLPPEQLQEHFDVVKQSIQGGG